MHFLCLDGLIRTGEGCLLPQRTCPARQLVITNLMVI
jgi:hypothetical protein